MFGASGVLAAILAATGAAHGDPKREVPDYDGRGNPEADAGSWLLWIPRIALSPLYLVNEYALRRPLGAVVRHAERDRWADSVVHLFRFGEGGKSLIIPTAAFDLGVLPSVGVDYTGDDLLAAGNAVTVHVATWGPRWTDAAVADRVAIDDADSVQARVALERSQDNLFLGIGPEATRDTQARYGRLRLEGGAGYRRSVTDASRIDVEAGVARTSFLDGDCCGDPSLDDRIASGAVMAPPGYRETYATGFASAELTLDTRRPRPQPGSGGYLHLRARPSFDLHGSRSWIRYGGVVGGALDVTGHRRTFQLQLALDFVDAMAGGPIPFTEDPVLGGDVMPGFVTGSMTGHSTAAAQLGYSWPVWLGLDARTRVTVGNAFGDDLDGLSPRQLRLSGDVGLTTSTIGDHGFEILVGLGTETFARGAEVTSVRVAIGSRRSLR
ncbi:MAG TPA: hypothetical protein VFK02_28140 [Kofleriaceae bacterium]|nr:hypothetical protein [Kofleriaceae bacterium]